MSHTRGTIAQQCNIQNNVKSQSIVSIIQQYRCYIFFAISGPKYTKEGLHVQSNRSLQRLFLTDGIGLASISVWSRSDRREYSAITCDQRYEWSRSISTASLAASIPTTAVQLQQL